MHTTAVAEADGVGVHAKSRFASVVETARLDRIMQVGVRLCVFEGGDGSVCMKGLQSRPGLVPFTSKPCPASALTACKLAACRASNTATHYLAHYTPR